MSGGSRRTVLRAGLIGTAWLGLGVPLARAEGLAARVSGDFVLVDPADQRKKIEAAIDALVDEMNPLIRGIARRRLKETVYPAVALRIKVGSSHIEVVEPTLPKKRAPADGSAVKWSNDKGDTVKLKLWLADDRLREALRGQGNRDNDYVPSDDGGRLRMRSKIYARQFPHPLRFSLPYRRA